MEKILRLYTYVDGGINDTPFPDADNPIEIGAFRYDAKRMGGAPTITASVYYPSCLDDEWTDSVYAMFNGEKYFLKQTPTSSHSNEDERYKHDLELVSERVALDNVYFYDTVSDEAEGDDKPVSNSTKFVFHGDIHEFAKRLGHSLAQSGLDYTVHVDNGVTSESLFISFENAFFSNAIQEAYNTYNVPYYFKGKEIHFGLAGNNIEEVLSYGVDDALLSITKNNANYKVVNRVTGTGSSENIPFYYPNNSPKGNIIAETDNNFEATIVDHELYSNEIQIDGVLRKSNVGYSNLVASHGGEDIYSGQSFESDVKAGVRSSVFAFSFDANDAGDLKITFNPSIVGFREPNKETDASARVEVRWQAMLLSEGADIERPHGNEILFHESTTQHRGEATVSLPIEKAGAGYIAVMNVSFTPIDNYANTIGAVVYEASFDFGSESGWVDEQGKTISLASVGLETDGREAIGDTITQRLVKYVKTSQNLLPPIYRQTDGAERFYNATNGAYTDENGNAIVFANPFIAGRPKEHIITVDDIKPTIKETVVNGLRIDMFSDFAYDEGDNDETYEDEDGNVYFKHPYFYGKLRVMDFNLFDHAIEQQPMTISFTSGDCGACNFEIGVTEEYPQKNPVQVYEEDTTIDGILHKAGSLKRDENGMIVAGVEGTQQQVTTFQDRQQDTSKYEVWIALRKEEATYGILMPQGLHRPKACSAGQNNGDTFVILGINLPFSYIENAEKKLEREIIKYIQENNVEKFKFSIAFSRIYFEENPDVLELLNENSSLKVSYDGRTYDLYVSSFSYSMSENDVLPEIRVELDDTLKTSQNALQNAINEVKSTLGSAINEVASEVTMQKRAYVSKTVDDTAQGVVNFSKGIKFGEGGKVEIFDNNSAKLTIEYLEVTKQATFTSIEIQEKTHVGGQILVTPASMNCGEVEELEDAYRCYFQTKGADGSDEIFNQFAVGDQAICQTFNAWGSKYYWRLVIGVGEDYIDLSKTDCDEGSGVPSAGDKIIQMGNRNDEARQNAIIIAAYGSDSPYIVQYKGISNYDLPNTDNDERITTLLSPRKNILTGVVRMQAGSEGLENFAAWAELKEEVEGKASASEIEGYKYLVQALQQPTEVLGGIILTSNIQLRDSDGSIKSGINGIYDANATGGGIAAWYGGAMSEDSAKTVLRFDGSGFFANKNITWDNEGGASFAGGKITITKEGALIFSDNIAFGSEENETVASIIEKLSTVLSYFSLEGDELTTEYQLRIKNNLIVAGDTSTRGTGQDIPSGIDEAQLKEYLDTNKYITSDYAYSKEEVNRLIDEVNAGDIDLTNYYTKEETTSEIASAITALNVGQYATKASLETLHGEVDNIEAVLGMDEEAEGIINTWNEVKAFLDGYSSSDDLAAILSGMNADIATRALGSDLDALAVRVGVNESAIEDNATNIRNAKGEIDGLKDNKADWGTSLAHYGITDAYTKTEVANELAKYLLLESANQTIKGNITIEGNLIVTGDTASGARGTDSGTDGTLIGVIVNGTRYEDETNGMLDLSTLMNQYALATEIPSLDGYAKLTDIPATMAWTAITGKPSFAAVATSGSYNDLSNKPTIPTTLPASDVYAWAKAATKPSYKTSEVAEETNLYFTNARAVSALADTLKDYVTKTALASDLGEYASKEWVNENGYITGITLTGDDYISVNGYKLSLAIDAQGGLTNTGQGLGIYQIPSAKIVTDALGYTPANNASLTNYLPKSGGTIDGSSSSVTTPLTINTTYYYEVVAIGFNHKGVNRGGVGLYTNGAWLVYGDRERIGIRNDGKPVYALGYNQNGYELYHTGNFKPADYLPKSGGTIEAANARPLVINSTSSDKSVELRLQKNGVLKAEIGHHDSHGVYIYDVISNRFMGINTDGTPYYHNGSYKDTLIHSGNYADYALPLSGGTISGDVGALHINRSNEIGSFIGYSGTNGTLGYLGFRDVGMPGFFDANWNAYFLIHSGNYSSYALPKSGGTMKDAATIKWGNNKCSWDGAPEGFIGMSVLREDAAYGYYAGLSFKGYYGFQIRNYAGTDIYEVRGHDSNTWGTWRTLIHSGNIGSQSVNYASSAGNATTIRGWDINIYNNKPFGGIPIVANSGVMSIGRYIDFYYTDDMSKYAARIQCQNTTYIDLTLPSSSGTLARLTDNVASATKLQTARTIWGQSFDGTGDVSGSLANVRHIYMTAGYHIMMGDASVLTLDGNNLQIAQGVSGNTIIGGGNVLIGTTDVSWAKLNVHGAISTKDYISFYRNGNEYGFVGLGTNSNNNISLYSIGELNMYATNGISSVSTITMSSATSWKNEKVTLNYSGLKLYGRDAGGYIQSISFATYGETVFAGLFARGGRGLEIGASHGEPWVLFEPNGVDISGTLSVGGNTTINGNLVVAGDTSSGSDIRFKDKITDHRIALSDIAEAPLFTFKWNDREDDSVHLGSSAQYWEGVAPWLVKGEDFKTLDYSTLGVAIGISLANKTINLEDRVKILEKENKALKEQIRRIQYGS